MTGLGREACGDLAVAERREWLVTNGLGGYASGTVAGVPTRRYHGLLVAAARPPAERRMLVSALAEIASYGTQTLELGATRWRDGTVAPQGFRFLERFRLDGSVAVWTFALGDALLEKRVWMEYGENATYVRYALVRGLLPLTLAVKALIDCRDHHALWHRTDRPVAINAVDGGVRVTPPDGIPAFSIRSAAASVQTAYEWYLGAEYARERERGLDDVGDVLHAADFATTLRTGDAVTFVLSTDAGAPLDGDAALLRRATRDAELVRAAPSLPALVLAADQFVVSAGAQSPASAAIVAGYPWFGVWGRDSMIALPGLLLQTGRAGVARDVLRRFGAFVDGGMLPNDFPDDGSPPEYNTVDGALLFVHALDRYLRATNDRTLLAELFAKVDEIVTAYHDGTRYGIGVDPADGLLRCGEAGVALTWMDARVDGVPVTPRAGKPVEVNALWYHALMLAARFARELGMDARPYDDLAARCRAGFARFWNPAASYCFDVLDAPDGNDASLRPNQLFAVALEHRALTAGQQRAVVDACALQLLTPAGLRTLAPGDPSYRGSYGGPQRERDAAYHQGTVWPWLIGPFVAAAVNAGFERSVALGYLEPVARSTSAFGLGTVAELAQGDAPFAADGCIAQAWSVASVLDAWALCNETSVT